MHKKFIGLLAITVCALPVVQAQQTDFDTRSSELVRSYCVTCHNAQLKTAGLLLDEAITQSVSKGPATWEKVVRRLRARSMPPQGMPRPSEENYQFLTGLLEAELDQNALDNPDPGRTVPHRLNRAEYANAIRDILGLEIQADELLPNDPASGHGFDNIADVLTLSPVLMERYISAAKTISRLAIGDPDQANVLQTYIIPDNLEQDERISVDLPFASRGGTAINHYFPADGEYMIRVSLHSIPVGIYAGKIVGFTKQKRLEIRLDGELLEQFTVGGGQDTDEHLFVRAPVKAGMHTLGVSFQRDRTKAELIRKDRLDGSTGDGAVSLVEVEGPFNMSGVGDTISRRKIFSCYPEKLEDETACATEILNNLAHLAYRRPLLQRDLDRLVSLYQSGREQGEFDSAISMAIQGILISPKFLFRVEKDPRDSEPGNIHWISDVELASRLSFFLWSSVPDLPLLELAEQGRLKEPEVLAGEVQRMIQDPRSFSLIENFASQWLHVRNLDLLSPPDPSVFPDYNENLKTAFKKEIELLFDYVMRNDRSILDFLNADYTFLNERLADHYGIKGIRGSHFRKVSLDNEIRRGILSKGAVLTVTSYATRTSPTLRGKWVLENILGTPPPPPPPDVPSLKDDPQSSKLSMRERMEMHRTNPVCASCHSLMDPLGLALENFDAIGAYRTINSDSTPIDATGILPNGIEFDGPAELREALWEGKEQFVGTMVERILIYALGRGLEYYDMPAVRKIIRESVGEDYRWSSIVKQVVESQPFQMRRSTRP